MDLIVCSEVNAILNMLGKQYIDLLPNDILENIRNNIDVNYQPIFTMDSLNIEELNPDTIDVIKNFYNQYWNEVTFCSYCVTYLLSLLSSKRVEPFLFGFV